jgi:hypothetical protein
MEKYKTDASFRAVTRDARSMDQLAVDVGLGASEKEGL